MVAKSISFQNRKLLNSSIRLGEVGGGRRTSPDVTSNVGNAGFSKALRISLAKSGLYDEDGDFELDAMLIDEKVTQRNGNYTVDEKIRYTLRERKTGKKVFSVAITGYGNGSSKIHINDRLRAAKERAVKMNIEHFLVALDRKFLE